MSGSQRTIGADAGKACHNQWMSDAFPELSSLHRSLQDLVDRLGKVAQAQKGLPGGDAIASEVLQIEATIVNAERRLGKLVHRL